MKTGTTVKILTGILTGQNGTITEKFEFRDAYDYVVKVDGHIAYCLESEIEEVKR